MNGHNAIKRRKHKNREKSRLNYTVKQ